MQPQLLAEQDSVSTFLLFDFVSVLLVNINWDEKEKHRVLVSFYESAHLAREGTSNDLTLELPRWEQSELGMATHSFQDILPWGAQDSAGNPRKAWPGGCGVRRVTSVPRWSGWGGCWRSSIEKGEERVVLCQCSPEESGNSPENEYFPSLSPFHQNCRPPTKSAALLPKSVELLYIIRVPRILLYCLLRKLGFKSYLVDRCTQMQELFLLQIWGYFKWHASNSL